MNFKNKIQKDVEAILSDVYSQIIAETENQVVVQDIIDTGRLQKSMVVNAISSGNKFSLTISYDPVSPDTGEHYALKVWNGFYAYGGPKYIPGRQWITDAVDIVDPADAIAKGLKSRGYKV